MSNLFRDIPKVDELLKKEEFKTLNKALLTKAIRQSLDILREDIKQKKIDNIDTKQIIQNIKDIYGEFISSSLKPLINATGIIIHTNLGRSLISEEMLKNASKTICNYCNLEYDIKKGTRGDRYSHITNQLQTLLKVEDALVVNNNASAVFLVLNTFAKNREVLLSRGELVEIGGSFRVPEVMRESGAVLKEIGTTNKTKLNDYIENISQDTALLMKVHKSNFDIVGFSEEVEFCKLVELAKEYNLMDYYDIGSAYIPKLPSSLGDKEPPLRKILSCNPSLVSFSADKLFGSVQAGIIVGKKEFIDKLKQNQLLRMLRVDKITLSLLQESVKAYIKEDYESIPTLKLLFSKEEELLLRAQKVKSKLKAKCEVIKSFTYTGGGAMPNRRFATIALAFEGDVKKIEAKFRAFGLIGRIESDRFLIDFRAILPQLDNKIVDISNKVFPI